MPAPPDTDPPRKRDDTKGRIRELKKVAYVLGAGFSVPARLPIMREFMTTAFRKLKESNQEDLARKFARVIERYSRAAYALNLQVGNMESLYCLAESAALADAQRQQDDLATLTEVIVRTYLDGCARCVPNTGLSNCASVPRRYVALKLPAGINAHYHECTNLGVCIYEAFLSHVLAAQDGRRRFEELDVIITFNYDLVIERALRTFQGASLCYGRKILEKGLSLPMQIIDGRNLKDDQLSRTVPLLKLHGSLNWCCSRNSEHVSQVLDPGKPEQWNNSCEFGRICLQPPTWRKDTSTDVFGKLARQTAEHLASAHKIVIIGYSLPETDQYFRYVLANVLGTAEFPLIEIWGGTTPPEAMAPRLENTFGQTNVKFGRVKYRQGGLSAFLRSKPAPARLSEKSP